MDLMSLDWGSPIALGVFLAGMGVFFWGLFSGIAALNRVKRPSPPPESRS